LSAGFLCRNRQSDAIRTVRIQSRRAVRDGGNAKIRTCIVTAFGVLRKESHAADAWRSNPGIATQVPRKSLHVPVWTSGEELASIPSV